MRAISLMCTCMWNVNMCVCVLFYIVFVRFCNGRCSAGRCMQNKFDFRERINLSEQLLDTRTHILCLFSGNE